MNSVSYLSQIRTLAHLYDEEKNKEKPKFKVGKKKKEVVFRFTRP